MVNIDIAQGPLDKAEALVGKLLQKKVDKGKMSAEDRHIASILRFCAGVPL